MKLSATLLLLIAVLVAGCSRSDKKADVTLKVIPPATVAR